MWHHWWVPSPGKDPGRAALPVVRNMSLPQPSGAGKWIYAVLATGNPWERCWGGVFYTFWKLFSQWYHHPAVETGTSHQDRDLPPHSLCPLRIQHWLLLEIVPQTCPLPLGRVVTFKFFTPLSLNENILYISLDKRRSQGYFGNSFASWFQIQQCTKGLWAMTLPQAWIKYISSSQIKTSACPGVTQRWQQTLPRPLGARPLHGWWVQGVPSSQHSKAPRHWEEIKAALGSLTLKF